jgi:hypothetical protein
VFYLEIKNLVGRAQVGYMRKLLIKYVNLT